MKKYILITGCSIKGAWHSQSIGIIYIVENDNISNYYIDNKVNGIPKSDAIEVTPIVINNMLYCYKRGNYGKGDWHIVETGEDKGELRQLISYMVFEGLKVVASSNPAFISDGVLLIKNADEILRGLEGEKMPEHYSEDFKQRLLEKRKTCLHDEAVYTNKKNGHIICEYCDLDMTTTSIKNQFTESAPVPADTDWKEGDKFTTPETGDLIFTVNKVLKYDVKAKDRRSASGTTSFTKNWITKVQPDNTTKPYAYMQEVKEEKLYRWILPTEDNMPEYNKVYTISYGHPNNRRVIDAFFADLCNGDPRWRENENSRPQFFTGWDIEFLQDFTPDTAADVQEGNSWDIMADDIRQLLDRTLRDSGNSSEITNNAIIQVLKDLKGKYDIDAVPALTISEDGENTTAANYLKKNFHVYGKGHTNQGLFIEAGLVELADAMELYKDLHQSGGEQKTFTVEGIASYTKWVRETFIVGTGDVWRRQKDYRDNRTDEKLIEEYINSLK